MPDMPCAIGQSFYEDEDIGGRQAQCMSWRWRQYHTCQFRTKFKICATIWNVKSLDEGAAKLVHGRGDSNDWAHPSEEQAARERFIASSRRHKDHSDKLEAHTDLSADKSWKSKTPPKHKAYTVGNQLRATIFNFWMNVLLLAVPAGFVISYLDLNPIANFFVNFAAIMPLNMLFS